MVTHISVRAPPRPRTTIHRPVFPTEAEIVEIEEIYGPSFELSALVEESDVTMAEVESDAAVAEVESDVTVAGESDAAVAEESEETTWEPHADLEKISRKAAEGFETDFNHMKSRIHRFPPGLRGLGSRYIVPKVVAIGPYHRGLDHLMEMEKVKQVASYHFALYNETSYGRMYSEVLSLASAARSLYANDGVASTMSDVEFADMMFLDGCFLLQYMQMFSGRESLYSSLVSCFDSNQHCISNDIMLLENQLPWVVLEALLRFAHMETMDVLSGIAKMGRTLELRGGETYEPFGLHQYTPPHLLGLLRFYKTGSNAHQPRQQKDAIDTSVRPMSKTIGAVELAEVGIKLTSSVTPKFRDMGMKRTPMFGQVFVVPLLLDEIRSCWLVNMVAFEVCIVTDYSSDPELPVVSSYVALLAMLMDREEDMHKLRSRRLVQGELTNKETLEFFKTLIKHIGGGPLYTEILEEIEDYKRKRWMWIKVHSFFYKNYKIICAVLSVMGVLVGIFKALFSVTKH